uniref:ankyrin repeat and SOCS box protein 16 isoform X1 n=1 Tax=Agelaius phoeniceus TaxID=39638 RepID=UPI0023EAF9EE|nr:ankyrin repeat and SOCS box protein 16 isoform X1 [Agelaius phoeniceus]
MAHESFAFSPSALRSLRLQRELLERDDRRRALARGSAERRLLPGTPRQPPSPPRRRQFCRDPAVHNALYAGDLRRVQSIFKDEATANVVLETVSEELVWSPEQGLWVLSPRRQHTSALRIAAARGYEDCARHLLLRGAAVDAVVGGRAPLHDSAAAPHPNCARLLLAFGADPNVLSADGSAPLHLCTAPHSLRYGLTCGGGPARVGLICMRGPAHEILTPAPPTQSGSQGPVGCPGRVPGVSLGVSLGSQALQYVLRLSLGISHGNHGMSWSCPMGARVSPHPFHPFPRCAELLLAHGAQVNLGTRDRQVTALHVAARQGLVAHVELYLHHGADPSLRTHQGETPLNAAAAAAERPEDAERFLRVAERLLEAGAEPGAAGRKGHTPLHNACANGHPAMARLLLRHGADATVPNGAGDTPMDCALRAVREYRQQRPEETLALLLDHGALPAHPKMLRLCCQHPPALEVMLNAYDRVPPADGWVEAVPPELWEVMRCPGGSWAVPVSPAQPTEPLSPPQEHQEFYASAVRMAGQPRRLQHLARVAIRRHLGARCRAAVPRLALPPPLRRYLQLPIEGLIS